MASIIWITERHPPDPGGMAVSSGRLVSSLRDRGRRVTTLQLLPEADRFELGGDDLDWRCRGWQREGERLFALKRRELTGKILVGFGGWTAGYFAALWGRWLGVPSLVLFRGNDLDRLSHDPRQGWMVHRILELATVAGGVSTEMCARLASLRSGPTLFTPIGIDPREWARFPADEEKAASLRSRHTPNGKGLVGIFGQLKGKKGLDTALTVFRDYGLDRMARLLTVGDIPADLKGQSAVCPFWSHEPFRDRDALLPCYLACDVVFVPSLHDGMPNVLLEAMLCGRLVVASMAGGIPDVITDGENGLLFPAGDGVAACETLAHALSLPAAERAAVEAAAHRTALTFHRDREAAIIAEALVSLEQCHGL